MGTFPVVYRRLRVKSHLRHSAVLLCGLRCPVGFDGDVGDDDACTESTIEVAAWSGFPFLNIYARFALP